MLPLPAAITSQLDKASIIRLTMSFLKLKDFTANGDPQWNRENKAVNKFLKSWYLTLILKPDFINFHPEKKDLRLLTKMY